MVGRVTATATRCSLVGVLASIRVSLPGTGPFTGHRITNGISDIIMFRHVTFSGKWRISHSAARRRSPRVTRIAAVPQADSCRDGPGSRCGDVRSVAMVSSA
jgi:hypothetical protein